MSMVAKWGEAVANRGFAQIPNYLLQVNQFIDGEHRLSPVELLLLIQISAAWWHKDQLPYPSVDTLALRCGASGRQVQRAISHLEKLKLVERVKRRQGGIIASNAYDLNPLARFLSAVAEHFPNEHPRQIKGRRPLPYKIPGDVELLMATTNLDDATLKLTDHGSNQVSREGEGGEDQ